MEISTNCLFLKKEELIEKLTNETTHWSHFLDVLFEVLQFYASEITTKKEIGYNVQQSQMSELSEIIEEEISQNTEMKMMVNKHLKDIINFRECDEVDSEQFYFQTHSDLKNRIENNLNNFYKVKLHLKNKSTNV